MYFQGSPAGARAHLVGDRGRCAPPVSLYVPRRTVVAELMWMHAAALGSAYAPRGPSYFLLVLFLPTARGWGASGQPPLAVGACGAPQRRRTLPEGLRLCQAGKRNGEPCVGTCTHRLRALPRARPLHCRLATLALPPKVKAEKERRKAAERERMGAFPFCNCVRLWRVFAKAAGRPTPRTAQWRASCFAHAHSRTARQRVVEWLMRCGEWACRLPSGRGVCFLLSPRGL